MVHVSQLGQLGRSGVGSNLVGDILNAVGAVVTVAGTAVNGADGSTQLTPAQVQAIKDQQAVAAAAKAAEESKKTWMYVGFGVGVLAIGGGLLYMVKHKR